VRLEELGQLKKMHLIGTRTRDLPACSIVAQPTMLPRAPIFLCSYLFITDAETVVSHQHIGLKFNSRNKNVILSNTDLIRVVFNKAISNE
jgi:hypothetical protein